MNEDERLVGEIKWLGELAKLKQKHWGEISDDVFTLLADAPELISELVRAPNEKIRSALSKRVESIAFLLEEEDIFLRRREEKEEKKNIVLQTIRNFLFR